MKDDIWEAHDFRKKWTPCPHPLMTRMPLVIHYRVLMITMGKCKEYSRIHFYRKKPSKPLQNTVFYALVSIICGGKPLITTNKLAGPVGKKGVLGGVYIGCEMHEKPQKKITEPVTK